MQSIFRRVRQIQLALSRRHESLLLQGVASLDAFKPVYERSPPWSARWTYPIIFAQIGVSCALTELIMHHWTQLKPTDSESESLSQSKTDPDQTKALQQQQPEYELRPLYQRAGAALGQFCVGAFVCILLLNSRARIVHKLYLLPSSSLTETALSPKLPKPSLPRHPKSKSKVTEEKILVMQNVYHFRGQGNVFPFSDTTLVQGYDPNEVAFEVKGRRGKFYLGLEGACVNGERFDSAWKAREALFRVWYGEKGKREMARFNWV